MAISTQPLQVAVQLFYAPADHRQTCRLGFGQSFPRGFTFQ
ncbi:MAG TPA: hypothetical protein V6D16_08240 [Candidatus Obscuribacterales bacterium]